MDGVSAYVAWHESVPTVILLFQVRNRTAHVLNEMIDLKQEEIQRFASYLFDNLPQVRIISFKAIRTEVCRLVYPFQQYNAKETYVITLPATPDQYTAMLGKGLREKIPYKLRKLEREHPAFESRFYEKEEIPEQVLKDLIRLSEERIARKVGDFSHDELRIIALARQCGFVHVMTVDGKVCGGSVNYYIGSNAFLELIARDPSYSIYSIGMLTAYLSICESIRRGKKKFYLGGGRFDYKEKLLGVLTDADHVEIYRSRAAMLSHLGNAARTLAHACLWRAKVWIHTHKEHALSRLTTSAFHYIRHRKARLLPAQEK